MLLSRPERAKADIPALTALRAIGALWVVFYHFNNELRFFGAAWIQAGYLGVDLFFVLSGFVIAYSYADGFANGDTSYRSFFTARLARIYPMHLFSLLVLLVMYRGGRAAGIPLIPSEYTGHDFLLNLLLIQSWGFSDHLSWNYPSWSISTEWFVYLCFPAVAVVLSKLRSPRQVWTWWTAMLATITVTAAIQNEGSLDLLYGWSLVRGGCEFLMGALLLVLYRFDPAPSISWSRTAALAVLIGFLWFPFRGSDFIYPIVFSLLIFAAARADGLMARMLSFRPIVYLGRISYSIYMTHILFRKLIVRWVHLEVPPESSLVTRLAVFGLCVVLAVAVAGICYHGLESPARVMLRRLGRRNVRATA